MCGINTCTVSGEGIERTYVGVICEIGPRLIGRRRGGRTLPAGDVDGVKVLGHLSDHDRVQAAVGEAGLAVLEAALECVPQFLAHSVVGIFLLYRAALRNNLLGSKGTARVAPSAVLPPLLDSLHLGLEGFLLGVDGVG